MFNPLPDTIRVTNAAASIDIDAGSLKANAQIVKTPTKIKK